MVLKLLIVSCAIATSLGNETPLNISSEPPKKPESNVLYELPVVAAEKPSSPKQASTTLSDLFNLYSPGSYSQQASYSQPHNAQQNSNRDFSLYLPGASDSQQVLNAKPPNYQQQSAASQVYGFGINPGLSLSEQAAYSQPSNVEKFSPKLPQAYLYQQEPVYTRQAPYSAQAFLDRPQERKCLEEHRSPDGSVHENHEAPDESRKHLWPTGYNSKLTPDVQTNVGGPGNKEDFKLNEVLPLLQNHGYINQQDYKKNQPNQSSQVYQTYQPNSQKDALPYLQNGYVSKNNQPNHNHQPDQPKIYQTYQPDSQDKGYLPIFKYHGYNPEQLQNKYNQLNQPRQTFETYQPENRVQEILPLLQNPDYINQQQNKKEGPSPLDQIYQVDHPGKQGGLPSLRYGYNGDGCPSSSHPYSHILLQLFNILLELLDHASERDKAYSVLLLLKKYLEVTPPSLEKDQLLFKLKLVEDHILGNNGGYSHNHDYVEYFNFHQNEDKTSIVIDGDLPGFTQPQCRVAFTTLIQTALSVYQEVTKQPNCEPNSWQQQYFKNSFSEPKQPFHFDVIFKKVPVMNDQKYPSTYNPLNPHPYIPSNTPPYNPPNQHPYNPSNQRPYNPSNQLPYNPSNPHPYNPLNPPSHNTLNPHTYNPPNQPPYNPSNPNYPNNPLNPPPYNPLNPPPYNPSNRPPYDPSNPNPNNPFNPPPYNPSNPHPHNPFDPPPYNPSNPHPYNPLNPHPHNPSNPHPYNPSNPHPHNPSNQPSNNPSNPSSYDTNSPINPYDTSPKNPNNPQNPYDHGNLNDPGTLPSQNPTLTLEILIKLLENYKGPDANSAVNPHILNLLKKYLQDNPNPDNGLYGLRNVPGREAILEYLSKLESLPNGKPFDRNALDVLISNLQRWFSVTKVQKLPSIPNNAGFIELTYVLQRPKPLIYHPVYYVKYRLPYNTFVHNFNNLISNRPELETQPTKLYQELIALSNVTQISPGLDGYHKEEVLKLVFSNGALVDAKLRKGPDNFLNEQLEIIRNLNSNLGPELFGAVNFTSFTKSSNLDELYARNGNSPTSQFSKGQSQFSDLFSELPRNENQQIPQFGPIRVLPSQNRFGLPNETPVTQLSENANQKPNELPELAKLAQAGSSANLYPPAQFSQGSQTNQANSLASAVSGSSAQSSVA